LTRDGRLLVKKIDIEMEMGDPVNGAKIEGRHGRNKR